MGVFHIARKASLQNMCFRRRSLLIEFLCKKQSQFVVVQVREIATKMKGIQGLRWQSKALGALQTAAEEYLTTLFEDA